MNVDVVDVKEYLVDGGGDSRVFSDSVAREEIGRGFGIGDGVV